MLNKKIKERSNMGKCKEKIFKFCIVSNDKDWDNRKLTIKIRFFSTDKGPKIESRGENFFSISDVENYEVMPESTSDYKHYFTVKRDFTSHQHDLIIRMDKKSDSLLFMSIPDVINE